MATAIQHDPSATPRSTRLTAATDDLHEYLHTLVADADPFASRERFGLWLSAQYRFQTDIEPLYRLAALRDIVPDLAARSRLSAVTADLADLALPRPEIGTSTPPDRDIPAALGWLFVAEGSTLGAAILLKRARVLGLSETFGARHLAADPAGRARHWKQFTRALDNLELDDDGENRLTEAARAAFRHFGGLLRDTFRLPA
ncbi:Heme oxygenase-like protein [Salinisphaera sp. PC39]|uniref:biliverdin-producing heme oxygenase n=1 Tax=Salinisphaera sp. PC39 TaxID=1304156 RepID=UPI00333E485C